MFFAGQPHIRQQLQCSLSGICIQIPGQLQPEQRIVENRPPGEEIVLLEHIAYLGRRALDPPAQDRYFSP
ncbi:hypothetical protein D3C73_1207140 [compost metagenome]